MLKLISIIAFIYLASFLGEGEAITCYHCFDSFNRTVALRSYSGDNFGQNFVRCDKNMNKWNTWTCPPNWPVCIIALGEVSGHVEIIRTCGELDFCSKYKPPLGVKLESCRECNTDLCNNFVEEPEPPVKPDALFKFNINLNLKVIRNSGISVDESK